MTKAEQPTVIEYLVDERLNALVDKDWERYNHIGYLLLCLAQEGRVDNGNRSDSLWDSHWTSVSGQR